MSTIIASNISDGTTSVGTGYVVNGSAKAWVNFNGSGTIAASGSFNVSSLVDNGAGDYTVNFTNSLASSDYAPLLSLGVGGNACSDASNLLRAVGSVTVDEIRNQSNSQSDVPQVVVAIHGDLA